VPVFAHVVESTWSNMSFLSWASCGVAGGHGRVHDAPLDILEAGRLGRGAGVGPEVDVLVDVPGIEWVPSQVLGLASVYEAEESAADVVVEDVVERRRRFRLVKVFDFLRGRASTKFGPPPLVASLEQGPCHPLLPLTQPFVRVELLLEEIQQLLKAVVRLAVRVDEHQHGLEVPVVVEVAQLHHAVVLLPAQTVLAAFLEVEADEFLDAAVEAVAREVSAGAVSAPRTRTCAPGATARSLLCMMWGV
jgi:hypothetical protein